MSPTTPGIHHVTAIGSDPNPNYEFYTETLGLRLVKRSVNQDDVSVYHLFYADRSGSPGTSMTVFPYQNARSGRVGTGQVSTTAFLIPETAVDYWIDRLEDHAVDVGESIDRFGDTVVPFRDPDGLPLELVARGDAPAGDPPDGPVPPENAIRGFFGVGLLLASAHATASLLEEMGFRLTERADGRARFESNGELGYVVDLLERPQAQQGIPGAGTVHHVAFQIEREDQPYWRELLMDAGLQPTEVIDRKWFESIYARTAGGVLFEFATKEPGYTVDEDLDELGDRLTLPSWLEGRREEIEAGLSPLHTE